MQMATVRCRTVGDDGGRRGRAGDDVPVSGQERQVAALGLKGEWEETSLR
jgi:hypothetical protein